MSVHVHVQQVKNPFCMRKTAICTITEASDFMMCSAMQLLQHYATMLASIQVSAGASLWDPGAYKNHVR